MHTRKLRHEISIHALTTKLWAVLTHPDYTSQYLFDDRVVSGWTKESELISETSEARGKVEESVPGISLQYLLYRLEGITDAPVHFHFQLVPEEGGICLGLSLALLLSDELYHATMDYCRNLLQKIKWLAEYS